MAISNHIKLGINFRENKNEKSTGYGKMYAEIDRNDGLTTRGLAAHLAEHNFGMGEDAIYAVMNRHFPRWREARAETRRLCKSKPTHSH